MFLAVALKPAGRQRRSLNESLVWDALIFVHAFQRRAEKGQCFHRPYLGVREFPANFALVGSDAPTSELPTEQSDRELGWVLLDMDYADGMRPRFFRADVRSNRAVRQLTRPLRPV